MITDYDSILVATDSNVVNSSEFYAIGQSVPDLGFPMAERPYCVCGDDVLVGGILLLFVVLVAVLVSGKKMMLHQAKSFFTSKRMFADDMASDTSNKAFDVLALVSISALSLSLMYFNHLAMTEHFSPTLGIPYWIIGVGYVAFMLFVYVKAWLYSFVNWLFFDRESRQLWISHYIFLTSATALAFYPLLLVDVFADCGADFAIWACTMIVFLYEILLFFKLFTNFKTKKYGYLLILLYFCSVEVMPALVLWNGLTLATDNIIVKNIL